MPKIDTSLCTQKDLARLGQVDINRAAGISAAGAPELLTKITPYLFTAFLVLSILSQLKNLRRKGKRK